MSDSYTERLKTELSGLFFSDVDHSDRFFLTENGRTGLYIFFKSLSLKSGNEVAVQPFTCNSAINPIIWNGLKPVYIDIKKDTLSMDPELLREALNEKNNRIKAVLLQHTFGIPGSIEEIQKICKEYDLILIEDCAHAIGENLNGKKLGTVGDAAVISFGLEKQLPTKVGGGILINNIKLIESTTVQYNSLKPIGWTRTFLWLMNPLVRIISRKLGGFGKSMIRMLEDLGLFEVGFSEVELTGGMPERYPRKISRPIARVALEYLGGLESILSKREADSQKYKKMIIDNGLDGKLLSNIRNDVGYLKFPFYADNYEDREKLQKYLIERNVYLSDWYENAIYPAGTDHKGLHYVDGSCQHAEEVCRRIINLPTGDPFNLNAIDYIAEYYGSGCNK